MLRKSLIAARHQKGSFKKRSKSRPVTGGPRSRAAQPSPPDPRSISHALQSNARIVIHHPKNTAHLGQLCGIYMPDIQLISKPPLSGSVRFPQLLVRP